MPPAGTNMGYKLVLFGKRPGMAKTAELVKWERDAALFLGGWKPPARTPLHVSIVLEVPPLLFRKGDIDSPVKFLVDLAVGRRRDAWVDSLTVTKSKGDGWAVVTVEPIGAAPAAAERK